MQQLMPDTPMMIGAVSARHDALFGLDTFEVIEADPACLREVAGIGSLRADRIATRQAKQKVVRDIMLFLNGHVVAAPSSTCPVGASSSRHDPPNSVMNHCKRGGSVPLRRCPITYLIAVKIEKSTQ